LVHGFREIWIEQSGLTDLASYYRGALRFSLWSGGACRPLYKARSLEDKG
jgi:hypothetical protein